MMYGWEGGGDDIYGRAMGKVRGGKIAPTSRAKPVSRCARGTPYIYICAETRTQRRTSAPAVVVSQVLVACGACERGASGSGRVMVLQVLSSLYWVVLRWVTQSTHMNPAHPTAAASKVVALKNLGRY
eukprot:scaffold56666_cov57-Phaeocystis_antarctica.AAC.3